MKNVLNIICVLFLFITMFVACGQENLITDTSPEDTRIKTRNSDNNLQETNVGIPKTDVNKNRPEYITQLIVEPPVENLDDVVEVIEENVEDVDIEDNEIDNVEINDVVKEVSKDNMVKIDALNLYVDIYELSIEEYIKEFPDKIEILIERAGETNPMMNLPPPFNDYPAILTYAETVEYAERVGKRVMSTDEWRFIAKGNGNRGIGNVIVNNPHCDRVLGHLIHVNDSKNPPNGYGVYEMMGNLEEWCYWLDVLGEGAPHFTKNRLYPYIAGVNFDECLNLIRNWLKTNPAQRELSMAVPRYVVDIN